MLAASGRKRGAVAGAHRSARGATVVQSSVVQCGHERLGRAVFHGPQAHDERARARDAECAPQTQNAFVDRDLADARIATGQHDPLRRAQVERRDFLGEQNLIARVCP